jgi:hypothetical protein
MYKSFEIRNFRCFKDITLRPLERLNLIAGKNNSGKTSFLEALFLHSGPSNPNLPLRINIFRGIDAFPIYPEEIWGPLFFDGHTEGTIEITSTNERNEHDTLKITLEEAEESFISPSVGGTTTTTTTSPPSSGAEHQMSLFPETRELILTYKNGTGRTGIARAYINQQGQIKGRQSTLKHKYPGVFLPARRVFLGADADRFSKLDRKGEAEQLLNTMKLLEPRLTRLAVLTTGGIPMINGDIGLKELVPLPMMGEGMVRLLSILLAIYDSINGIVLIDEVENGLHHKVMVKVWEAIAVAARQAKAQIFATTHSWECAVAAHQALKTLGDYDLLFHRFNMTDGEIKAVTYNQKKLETAISTGLEVR